MIGRRVASFVELEQGGDYSGPEDAGDGQPRVWFLLPFARDDDAPAGGRSVFSVTSPPHTFRECDDGSLEVRESILAYGHQVGAAAPEPIWHGYLDEGHVWRQV